MARFFKTAKPNFVNDFMYQPPWELMKMAMDTQEKGIDESLASTELFRGLEIQHIGTPEEVENVNRIRESYANRADDIARRIQEDPMSWRRLSPEISSLGRELRQDMTSGDISKIQRTYAERQKWLKDNEKLKETDPFAYNALLARADSDWRASGKGSLGAIWAGRDGVARPDIVSEWDKIAKAIQANSTPTADGNFIYEGEIVTPERVQEIAWNRIQADPNFRAYSDQMGNYLGMQEYLESPFEFRDAAGNILSPAELSTMAPEELEGVTRHLNPRSPYSRDLAYATGVSAYSKQTIKMENPVAKFQRSLALAKYNQDRSDARATTLKQMDMAMEGIKANIKAQKDLEAKKAQEAKIIRDLEISHAKETDEEVKQALGTLLDRYKAEITLNSPAGPDLVSGDHPGNIVVKPMEKPYSSVLNSLKYGTQEQKAIATELDLNATIYAREKVRAVTAEDQLFINKFDNFLRSRGDSNGAIADFLIRENVLEEEEVLGSLHEEVEGRQSATNLTDIEKQRKKLQNPKGEEDRKGELLRNYLQKKMEFMDKQYRGGATSSFFYPVNNIDAQYFIDKINSEPNKFFVTDEKGNIDYTPKNFVAEGLKVTGGNVNGSMALQVESLDGKTRFVFPSQTNMQQGDLNYLQQVALRSVPKGSILQRKLTDPLVNRWYEALNSVTPRASTGMSTVNMELFPGRPETRVTIAQNPAGGIFVMDEEGRRVHYPSVADLYDVYLAAEKEAAEAAAAKAAGGRPTSPTQ